MELNANSQKIKLAMLYYLLNMKNINIKLTIIYFFARLGIRPEYSILKR